MAKSGGKQLPPLPRRLRDWLPGYEILIKSFAAGFSKNETLHSEWRVYCFQKSFPALLIIHNRLSSETDITLKTLIQNRFPYSAFNMPTVLSKV